MNRDNEPPKRPSNKFSGMLDAYAGSKICPYSNGFMELTSSVGFVVGATLAGVFNSFSLPVVGCLLALGLCVETAGFINERRQQVLQSRARASAEIAAATSKPVALRYNPRDYMR
jgi:hypothetical protein